MEKQQRLYRGTINNSLLLKHILTAEGKMHEARVERSGQIEEILERCIKEAGRYPVGRALIGDGIVRI